jgi:flagellar hook-associated protein 1
MSITTTLSSALSGLTAASRAAEVVSSNVANALTEGYARRELELGARRVGDAGQGVAIIGVNRVVDQVLLTDRRVAAAGSAGSDLRADFLARLESLIGTGDDPGSIGARINALDSALLEASAHPESTARLTAIIDAAQGLSRSFATISEGIQAERMRADEQIATDVAQLNTALGQVADLNRQIRSTLSAGRDASSLMDQRQGIIDDIAAIVPLREVPRDHGEVTLFTTGGAVLLEGRPAVIGFAPVGVITPDMTRSSGALSGLTINGQTVAEGDWLGGLAGGRLGAAFGLRDGLAVSAQARLDSLARDLVTRFADPAVDPTLAPGAAGFFTDSGAAFVATDEAGLSQRLRVNAAVDPAAGGALWRLRDGLGATIPGPPGNGALLGALHMAMSETRVPASSTITTAPRNLSALAADMLSLASTARVASETEASYHSARHAALREMELRKGVDTDQELQSLLAVEQAYAANARIIQTVDEMIKTLLGL